MPDRAVIERIEPVGDFPAVGQAVAAGAIREWVGFQPDHVNAIRARLAAGAKDGVELRAVQAVGNMDPVWGDAGVGEAVGEIRVFPGQLRRGVFVERGFQHDEVAVRIRLVAIDQRQIDAAVLVRVLLAVRQPVAVAVRAVGIGFQPERARRDLRPVDAGGVVDRRRVRDEPVARAAGFEQRPAGIRNHDVHAAVAVGVLDVVINAVVVGVRFVRIRHRASDLVGAPFVKIKRPGVKQLVAGRPVAVVGGVENRRVEISAEIRDPVTVRVGRRIRVWRRADGRGERAC